MEPLETIESKRRWQHWAANTGALIAATPLIGSLLAAIVLGEPLSPLTLLAIALVTGGVVLIARRMGGSGGPPAIRGSPWLPLSPGG